MTEGRIKCSTHKFHACVVSHYPRKTPHWDEHEGFRCKLDSSNVCVCVWHWPPNRHYISALAVFCADQNWLSLILLDTDMLAWLLCLDTSRWFNTFSTVVCVFFIAFGSQIISFFWTWFDVCFQGNCCSLSTKRWTILSGPALVAQNKRKQAGDGQLSCIHTKQATGSPCYTQRPWETQLSLRPVLQLGGSGFLFFSRLFQTKLDVK